MRKSCPLSLFSENVMQHLIRSDYNKSRHSVRSRSRKRDTPSSTKLASLPDSSASSSTICRGLLPFCNLSQTKPPVELRVTMRFRDTSRMAAPSWLTTVRRCAGIKIISSTPAAAAMCGCTRSVDPHKKSASIFRMRVGWVTGMIDRPDRVGRWLSLDNALLVRTMNTETEGVLFS